MRPPTNRSAPRQPPRARHSFRRASRPQRPAPMRRSGRSGTVVGRSRCCRVPTTKPPWQLASGAGAVEVTPYPPPLAGDQLLQFAEQALLRAVTVEVGGPIGLVRFELADQLPRRGRLRRVQLGHEIVDLPLERVERVLECRADRSIGGLVAVHRPGPIRLADRTTEAVVEG